MALFHCQDFVRALPGGTGESGATVTFKREADDTTITTATTDSDGFFQKSLAATATSGAASFELHPGPFYYTVTVGDYTRVHSSRPFGTAGPLHLPAQLFLNRAIGTGLISSPGSALNTGAVTADGADRTVDVATFAASVAGILVWNDAIRAINITANASGNPRIDTIVIEVVPQGEATEGKATLKVVDGTAAASPVAPTLTQSTALWQFPLADVAVANGAATISQANITDRRDYVERSTTTVEADVVTLEAAVDDLETWTALPNARLVAYYQNTYDPASMSASIGFTSTTVNLTFVAGYSSVLATDVYVASHAQVDGTLALHAKAFLASTTTATYGIFNNWPTALDPASGTLTILVFRLVTA